MVGGTRHSSSCLDAGSGLTCSTAHCIIASIRHRDMQYVFPDEEEEKERVLSGHGYGSGNSRFSGIQVQCALIDGSSHIEYVPGSHARWDTEEEYAVRKLDNCIHRFEEMP